MGKSSNPPKKSLDPGNTKQFTSDDLFKLDLSGFEKKFGRKHLYDLLDQFPASPDELKLYQADPLREEHQGQRNLVTCRECRKRRRSLQHHIPKIHKMTLKKYQEKW